MLLFRVIPFIYLFEFVFNVEKGEAF